MNKARTGHVSAGSVKQMRDGNRGQKLGLPLTHLTSNPRVKQGTRKRPLVSFFVPLFSVSSVFLFNFFSKYKTAITLERWLKGGRQTREGGDAESLYD